jgi:hypothetical protein
MRITTSTAARLPRAAGDQRFRWRPALATKAYPFIAYDNADRLWVAYEEGGAGWGKDFGAFNTNGVAVYQGRVIRLRGFERDGRAVEVAGDPGSVLPGMPNIHLEMAGTQSNAQKLDADPNNGKVGERATP